MRETKQKRHTEHIQKKIQKNYIIYEFFWKTQTKKNILIIINNGKYCGR